MKLDDNDHRILALLARDGRITNRELAREIGMSPSACFERVRRLEAARVILGYRAIISLDARHQRFEGWATIRVLDPPAPSNSELVKLIRDTPHIIEAHRVAGHYDYALHFLASDSAGWNAFRQSIESFDCEVQTRFGLVLETLK